MRQLNLFELRGIENAWQEGIYVAYADRETVLGLAAVGVIVNQLANTDMPIAAELRRVIELAQSNRKALT